MPRVRQALHQLRTDRRDPLHGGEERRDARALRSAEARAGAAEGLREAAGQRRGARTIADRVEATLQERPDKEIATADIGSFVMEELRKLDKVAYVRFASVYRHFRDINEFAEELKQLLNPKE